MLTDFQKKFIDDTKYENIFLTQSMKDAIINVFEINKKTKEELSALNKDVVDYFTIKLKEKGLDEAHLQSEIRFSCNELGFIRSEILRQQRILER